MKFLGMLDVTSIPLEFRRRSRRLRCRAVDTTRRLFDICEDTEKLVIQIPIRHMKILLYIDTCTVQLTSYLHRFRSHC
jgi:hypothetical protein